MLNVYARTQVKVAGERVDMPVHDFILPFIAVR